MYLIDIGNTDKQYQTYWGCGWTVRKTVGEFWENLAVLHLNKLGLQAYRPRQKFENNSPFYTLHQRDIHLKIDKVRRLITEVKSRRSPFKYQNVFVGDCESWDKKQFKVCVVIVIDQVTGNAMVAPGDGTGWLRVKGSKKLSYAIPLGLFTPLDVFAQAFKDGLYL